jgi:hypothetical protein
MTRFTRALMAWLLMLAIPLQGIAATAALLCALGQPTLAPAQPATGAAQASHHEHGAQHSAVSADPDLQPGQHQPAPGHAKAGHGKCSACASCCLGVGIVNSATLALAEPAGAGPIAFTPTALTAHTPEGQDPPPRPLLA